MFCSFNRVDVVSMIGSPFSGDREFRRWIQWPKAPFVAQVHGLVFISLRDGSRGNPASDADCIGLALVGALWHFVASAERPCIVRSSGRRSVLRCRWSATLLRDANPPPASCAQVDDAAPSRESVFGVCRCTPLVAGHGPLNGFRLSATRVLHCSDQVSIR